MKTIHDLSTLSWKLAGFTPDAWRFERTMEIGAFPKADVTAIPAIVPGSVQASLLAAGLVPDWNHALNHRACEWVENRHWIYEAELPADWLPADTTVRLHGLGLDYSGWVRLNNKEIGTFKGTFKPHVLDLSAGRQEGVNRLQLIFDVPPRWLGQFGYTSTLTEWKTRFNYTWDWMPRMVQTGIWDRLTLEVVRGAEIGALTCRTGYALATSTGWLETRVQIAGQGAGRVRMTLLDGTKVLRTAELSAATAAAAPTRWEGLAVSPWWPNGEGAQPLYSFQVELLDAAGKVHETQTRQVGFKHVEWRPCTGAPAGADPWICVVNGRPIFLQGVDWTPILPNYADVPTAAYTKRTKLYKDLGLNVLRVWGGAFLEKTVFYDQCDAAGLLVWQEFPLSSSGVDNWPPEDPTAIKEQVAIATSYIQRRQHHASLLLWCGGNELQGALDGGKVGIGKPADCTHPLLAAFRDLVATLDPEHRFLATSSSGPRFTAESKDFGKGLHWDVHGPWNRAGKTLAEHQAYFAQDDALFRSELGAPGASSAALIRQYAGGLPVVPGSFENPLWRRMYWWVEWHVFTEELGRSPDSLEEYVRWSQQRQADNLLVAVKGCKQRFPACGGVILWMGHDSYPCPTNTAIVDFHGEPKPAALALKAVWHAKPGDAALA